MSVNFSYTGTLDGHDVTGQVLDGKLDGDAFTTIEVQALLDHATLVRLGPWSGTATLDDEMLARATIAAILDHPSFTPSAPASDPLPPGAVS